MFNENKKRIRTLKQIKKNLNYGDKAECARQFGVSANTVHNVLNGQSIYMYKYIYQWLNERAIENMKIPKK
jgi:transcriptional regulator with XRE-family HTH domain